jgi:KipI family sensor histidine kinase inhibitor
MTLSALGDSAIVMVLGETVDEVMVARVRALAAAVAHHRPRGVVDILPAFASVTVFYDPMAAGGFAKLRADLEVIAARAEEVVVSVVPRRIEIPVCYGDEFGPDLPEVAAQHGMTAAEVIALHAAPDYLVQAIGFVPGFPYLGGMVERLTTPRRSTPRREVPAGSVGIGGMQTGVYPFATPGGWNLIGRTPLRMFDPARAEPSLVRVGDQVRFQPIARSEFQARALESVTEAEARSSDMVPGVEVVQPGMFTTVQDLGRAGHRAEGVVLSGAADPFALRIANLLVGNPADAAGLECTLIGPELIILHDTVVALAGAEFGDLPRWRPIPVKAGTRLKLGSARRGCRGYLAFAGGLGVNRVLGSRSTHVRARLGGFAGRPVQAGDVLPVPSVPRIVTDHWQIDERIVPPYSNTPTVRVVRGPQAAEFGPEFHGATFTVTPQADRMGARLKGPALARKSGGELRSSAVAPGTVQVPPDGQPIVLLADAQTLGGYPQIAHVITVDLPLVAQLRPGDTVRFCVVPLDEAHEHLRVREHALAMLREGLAQKVR